MLRAAELSCDAVMKATQVDGVYSADPKRDPTATRFIQLTHDEAITKNLAVMDTAAFALAREIAGRNPQAVRAAKRLINEAEDGTFDRILQAESDAQIALLGSANQREAVRANLEQRPPRFSDDG